jgi:hypothetical protein
MPQVTDLMQPIFLSTQWLALGSGSSDSVDGTASQVVAALWHAWDPAQEHACKRTLRFQTARIVRLCCGGTLFATYIFLLLVDMSNLEPYVLLCQRLWWVGDDVFEAL